MYEVPTPSSSVEPGTSRQRADCDRRVLCLQTYLPTRYMLSAARACALAEQAAYLARSLRCLPISLLDPDSRDGQYLPRPQCADHTLPNKVPTAAFSSSRTPRPAPSRYPSTIVVPTGTVRLQMGSAAPKSLPPSTTFWGGGGRCLEYYHLPADTIPRFFAFRLFLSSLVHRLSSLPSPTLLAQKPLTAGVIVAIHPLRAAILPTPLAPPFAGPVSAGARRSPLHP